MKYPPIDKSLTCVSFLLTGCVYVFLKSRGLHWYLSDENIYYYLAWDLSLSNIPYRDFFYANPPLLLPVLKVGGVLSGWSVIGLRAASVGASFLSGFFLYRILRPRLGSWAVLPLWIFWFSSLALRASTHATGINGVLFFIILSYFLAGFRKPILAGIALGLGLWTKTYALAGAPGLLVLIWLGAQKEHRMRQTLEFAVTLGAMLGLLALLGTLGGGSEFWRMNVAYHLNKPEGSGSFAATFAEVVSDNPATLWVVVLLVVFAASRILPAPSIKTLQLEGTTQAAHVGLWPLAVAGAAHCLTVLVFLALQNRIFDFYFLLLMPGLCLSLGALLGYAKLKNSDSKMFLAVLVASALLLSLPLIPNRLRPLFQGPVSYWDHEARHIDSLKRLAPRLETSEGGEICGDSGTAPLLALLAGKKLALGEADTNAMRFRSGNPTPAEFIRKLEESKVEWLLVRMQSAGGEDYRPVGMFSVQEFWEYANSKFKQEDAVRLNAKDAVVLFRRREG